MILKWKKKKSKADKKMLNSMTNNLGMAQLANKIQDTQLNWKFG